MICGKVAIRWVEPGGVIEAVTLALNPKNAFCPLLAFSEADQNSYTDCFVVACLRYFQQASLCTLTFLNTTAAGNISKTCQMTDY